MPDETDLTVEKIRKLKQVFDGGEVDIWEWWGSFDLDEVLMNAQAAEAKDTP